ncbi:MAG: GWxTD domain-containing protein [candidate division KSB1 bacterium]|nr:GWxTD domain-containing protein [candidate division KSB1 bacterium]MDZ7396301.1 GWxTD domain-containing protein [candidate division KSB1 bacterium]MDZ7411435.1 GWxTD domain-containing protein [candidate division KSB1 bacterium]MDZ7416248.1 GWxTD domain-containing protein [candidate division KSB1 bacterium]
MDLPVRSRGELRFYLDTASFRGPAGRTRQEFYTEIALEQLSFRPAPQGLQSDFQTSVVIADTAGNILLRDEWKQSLSARRPEELAGRMLPNQFELLLAPGVYDLTLTLTDLHSRKQGHAALRFQAHAIPTDTLALSDLQLATSIRVDSTGGKFAKHGFNVMPHASATFSSSLPLLYFYFEIYNLAAADSYAVQYAIRNARGAALRTLPAKHARQPGTSSVEVGALHAASLPDSVCVLSVQVADRHSGAVATHTKTFYVGGRTAAEERDSLIARLPEREFQRHLAEMQYLLSDADREMLKSLSPVLQRAYVSQIWRRLDPVPETPVNEFREEYFRRVQYANEQFTAGFSAGWQTDRGRVAIKFGIPNEVERFPARTHSKPYEVWTYFQEGRKQFIFADLDGFGKYELIYSSDERELTRPDWKSLIGVR